MLTLEELLNQTTVNTTEVLNSNKEDKKEVETPENWKPKNATTPARIVSFLHEGKMVPYAEIEAHYVKNKSKKMLGVFVCPKKLKGQECPMCTFGWDEYNKAKKLGSKDKEFKRFLPSREYVALVIERDTEEDDFAKTGYPILKSWKFPTKVREQIDVFLADAEYNDITHLTKGTDIKINFNKQLAEEGQLATSVTAARSSSPIFNKKYADAEKDFQTFYEVYQNMTKNACDPFGRFEVVDTDKIFDYLKRMSEETSDKKEVEHAAEAPTDSNLSEEAKMLALQKELSMK